jgi:catechol 2,3-dioxygenase-like lactoylglutathione lyase family enzyme
MNVDFLRGIVMRCPNALETKDFYIEQWGLTHVETKDDTVYFRGSSAEPFIYALKQDKDYGIDYINFGMLSRARVENLYHALQKNGVPLLSGLQEFTTYGGGYGFMALDPDGRRLRFSADVTPHAEAAPVLAKPEKVTHVVLNTANMEGLEAFYAQKLGFRVSDYSANQMVFLRCANDHHSIAFNRAPFASVNHVAFEMSTIDSYMRGIGRMKTKGQICAWGPGRHGPGNNPFAYFVSPSGFVIEFTAEVLQIDENTHEAQVWPRDVPEKMDQWMTAGPPTPAMRAVMMGRPDKGFSTGFSQ